MGLSRLGLGRLGLGRLGLGRLGLELLGLEILCGARSWFDPIERGEKEESGHGEESKEENGSGNIGLIEEFVNQRFLLIHLWTEEPVIPKFPVNS